MDSFKELPEVFIFAKHNLNTTDIETLAEQLAAKLNINIEYVLPNNEKRTIGTNTKTVNNSKLYTSINNKAEYVLEFGDEAKVFIKEIVVYNLPRIEFYTDMRKVHTNIPGGLLGTAYFNVIFGELHAMGADEVYIVEDSALLRENNPSGFTYNKFVDFVKSNCNYFTEPTQEQKQTVN